MIRTAIIILYVLPATAVLSMIAIIVAFFSRTGNPVHIIARMWSKSILFVSGIKVDVKGLANIDPGKSYIYMANHRSNFDIPVLLGCLPIQFRWLAKAELFKIPIFGRAMSGAGYVKIDRSNRVAAFKSIDEVAAKLKNGVSVMIFPEGTRSQDGHLKPFKKGGFVMAVDSGVPIVPIILRGTRSIMAKGSWRINPDKVTLSIEKPIDTSEFTRDTKEDLIRKVRGVIYDVFEKGKKFDTSA
ncbi:MAG: lysophospholipid acyltransferase family protein [Desulfobacterales bacterium]|jgi:1-acyl-sn-glycerol-3-phosphate acyltransferase